MAETNVKAVLVVDDSRIMRNIVKKSVVDLGIECNFFEASSGKDALEILKNNEISLVLLDWNMPGLSGIDFLKQIRANDTYNSLPIIMITSESARYNVIEALKCGATDYIVKPVDERLFKEKLSKVIF